MTMTTTISRDLLLLVQHGAAHSVEVTAGVCSFEESAGWRLGGEMLLPQQIFRTRAESQRVAWQACSPAYNTLSHIQVVCKGFISANILKGDVSDAGPEAIAIRVTSAEVIIVAFQHGF